MRLSYHFRVIVSYLSKAAYFNLPHLHLTPTVGMTPFKFRRDLWHPKTRVPMWHCLRDSAFSRFDIIPACDRRMDRQIDGQMDGHMTMTNT